MTNSQLSLEQQVSNAPDREESADEQYIEFVNGLAQELFKLTQPYHCLGTDSQQLLLDAARLRSKLPSQGKRKTMEAAVELVESDGGEDLSASDKKVLAAVITLSIKKMKEQILLDLGLSTHQQVEAQTLAMLLRLAVGLDTSRSQSTHIEGVETAPGGIWVVVEGPHADQDASFAQEEAAGWEAIGYMPLQVLETGIAAVERAQHPPLPQRMQSMGILPEDTMAEAGRKVWSYQLAEMLNNEEGTRKGEDIEALHDMRVASRRMRAAFDIFGDAFEPNVIKPYLKGLRATGRALGRVRDLDVFMEKADEYRETLPEEQRSGLEPLLESWKSEREKARAEMLAHLNSRNYHDFIWAFNSFLNTPGEGTRPGDQDPPAPDRVCEVAPVLIYTRLAAVRAYDKILGYATIEQLHALRIEFKKLRYAVEFFREVLGEESKPIIGELKNLQDHLGDLHDADIATQILREFLQIWEAEQESLPASEQQSPAGILNYLAARFNERQRLMTTFPDAWQRFSEPEFRKNLALAVSKL